MDERRAIKALLRPYEGVTNEYMVETRIAQNR